MPVEHQPSFYLTEEAAQKRIARLVERIAAEGVGCEAYRQVPASVRAMVDAAIAERGGDRRAA